MPTGYPDVVAVMLRKSTVRVNAQRAGLRLPHLRLVHHIHTMRRSSEQELMARLLFRPTQMPRLLSDLEGAGLIRRAGKTVFARYAPSPFVARRIIAVEAKMRDWHRAIEQAISNTWFASHSFVLLPHKCWTGNVGRAARRHGIGVLLFNGTRLSLQVRPRTHSLPGSYGSWLVNEWALRVATSTTSDD